MKRALLLLSLLLAVAGLLSAAGCGNDVTGPRPAPNAPDTGAVADSGAMPYFALEDVNPSSATYGRKVTPRQFLGQISAWYFGHST